MIILLPVVVALFHWDGDELVRPPGILRMGCKLAAESVYLQPQRLNSLFRARSGGQVRWIPSPLSVITIRKESRWALGESGGDLGIGAHSSHFAAIAQTVRAEIKAGRPFQGQAIYDDFLKNLRIL